MSTLTGQSEQAVAAPVVSTAAAPTAASMAACLSYCPATVYLTQFGSSESNSLIGQPGLLILL